MMGVPIYQVDAFTEIPFAGNPAAVCLLAESRDDRWMRDVAREMNLSETAFVQPAEDGFSLRWFTPAIEVDLCGHATLATAHVVWETDRLGPDDAARFRTRSGVLTARLTHVGIEMDFPATPARATSAPTGLEAALGAKICYVGRSRFDLLVELSSEQAVRDLRPDLAMLGQIEARGVIVTARATTPGYDFISRFFAPRAGIDEDPVTGSSHCCLGPFWMERLGRSELIGYQASQRGGTVSVRVAGDRTFIGGRAVTVLRGELADNGQLL
jgi:PhzF family phenazine biosynthesis protein